MKKIEAIFKPFKLDGDQRSAGKRIQRFSLFEVKGAGCQQITIKQYRSVVYPEDSSEVGVAILAED